MHPDLQTLLQRVNKLTVEQTPTEAQYLTRWQTVAPAANTSFELAVLGGACADRFAWVFVAGYQSAIRRVFDAEQFDGWAAFAVSEDRSGELAPVDWVEAADGDTLEVSGYKTWVAACDSITDLLIKAGRGGRARYLRIPVHSSGLALEAKPAGFLPELTQGVARLDAVKVGADQHLATHNIAGFSAYEVLYIYVAFAAWMYQQQPQLKSLSKDLIGRARALDVPGFNADAQGVAQFNAGIQELLAKASSTDEQWQRDMRLITMYNRS